MSLWGIPVLANARPGLLKVEQVRTPPGSVVGWIRCDDCCQWVTFDSGVAYQPAAPWTCKDNTWNIQLARCFSEKEFESVYVAWWVDTFDKRPVLCSTVHGKRLDFWYVYNTVTQLGGWSTVTANNGHYHVHPKSSPQQLSSLYLRWNRILSHVAKDMAYSWFVAVGSWSFWGPFWAASAAYHRVRGPQRAR